MLINGREFTVGADPEVFLNDGGKLVSAHDYLQGSKQNPFKVDKGAVQVDGIAAEFNIDPVSSYDQFQSNLDRVQEILGQMIGGANVIEDVSVTFDQDFMDRVPAENLILGCEADFNGWTMRDNNPPEDTTMMRTAGGHLHLGGLYTNDIYSDLHFGACARLARTMDETIGVYSILWDKDDKRRSMYGKAGCFRPKTYGMEYRTLSNKWIFSPKLVKFVYDGVEEALKKFFDPNYSPDPGIRHIIDESDRDSHFFSNNEKVKLLGV